MSDLRNGALQKLGMTVAALGYAWTLLQVMLMHPHFYWLPLTAPLCACAAGGLTLLWRRPLALRTGIFLTGLLALAAVSVFVRRSANAPFIYAVLAGVAPLVTSASSAFVIAGLGSVAMVLAARLLPGTWPAATLLDAAALTWIAALVAWLSSRNLYTVLVWALRGQESAWRVARDLQDERGKANQTMRALADANMLLKRTTYDLAQAREEAEHARQLKSQFAANISHELRTPLHLIVGFSQMMYNAPETYKRVRWTADLREDIRAIYESAQHLLGLIDDVLDLSRIEVAHLPVVKERVAIAPLVLEATETARSLLRDRPLDLAIKLPQDMPALYADPTRIRQVMLNLLNNAARFTEEGNITVRAVVGADEVEIVVEDTGIGIPPDQLQAIFSEFHQVDASLRRKHGGTGLGLALCKHFVGLHDGRIWVESELGHGSAFHFTLPLPSKQVVPLQVGRLPEGWHYPAARPPTPRPIVVLSPSGDLARLLRRHLGGTEVIEAPRLPDALALARDRQISAIVCESQAGAEPLAAEAAEATADLQLPVVTVDVPVADSLALEEGFTHCLMKPFTGEALLSVLRAAAPAAKRVMVADDDEGVVRLVRRTLAAALPEVTLLAAYDGRQAMALLTEAPDAILLDLVLPYANGLEVLQRARSLPELASVPLVAITAYGFEQEIEWTGTGRIAIERGRRFTAAEVSEWLRLVLQQMPARYLTAASPESAPAPTPAG
jgi:signal transduction histidine kinase/CheY-like chemotaxis protein